MITVRLMLCKFSYMSESSLDRKTNEYITLVQVLLIRK